MSANDRPGERRTLTAYDVDGVTSIPRFREWRDERKLSTEAALHRLLDLAEEADNE